MAFLLAQSGEIPYDIGAAIVSYRLKLQFGIGEAQRSRLIAQPG
jgi:hypothetical protein